MNTADTDNGPSTASTSTDIRIEPWTEDDLDLLRLINTDEMRKHVGGPETEEALLVRHRRYLEFPRLGTGQMFRIVITAPGGNGGTDAKAGSVGLHSRPWHGEQVWEMGWNVLPPFQGRGIAAAAVRLAVEHAAATGQHTWLHAFPSVDNPASNAVCRRVGFTLAGETDFEYPPGRFMLSNDWRINLTELDGS